MVTINVNTKSKQAKAFIELARTLAFVTIIETESEENSIVQ